MRIVITLALLRAGVTGTPPDVEMQLTPAQFLADRGLGCCHQKIIRHFGIDAISDISLLSERDIDGLWIPPVKRTLLKEVSRDERLQRRRAHDERHRSSRWQRQLLDTLCATAETLIRGFMLGFGLSVVYEVLYASSTFYQASDDLPERVRFAALRAAVVGSAVALVLTGSAIIVPMSVRSRWMMQPDEWVG